MISDWRVHSGAHRTMSAEIQRVGVFSPAPHTLRSRLDSWISRARLPVALDDLHMRRCKSLGNGKLRAALLDLRGLRLRDIAPEELLACGCPCAMCLDFCDAVPASWLGPMTAHNIAVLVASAIGTSALDLAISWLENVLIGPWAAEFERYLLEKEPVLESVSFVIATLLSHPWQVRHPRDLVAITDTSRYALKARSRAAGFRRVEHLLLHVRWRALGYLRTEKHMPSWRARLLVGIDDTSNFRRQLERGGISRSSVDLTIATARRSVAAGR